MGTSARIAKPQLRSGAAFISPGRKPRFPADTERVPKGRHRLHPQFLHPNPPRRIQPPERNSMPAKTPKNNDQSLRDHLVELLNSGNAHASFDALIKDLPPKLRGKKPENFPHTAWMLIENLRIAQWDILEFSRNPKYKP